MEIDKQKTSLEQFFSLGMHRSKKWSFGELVQRFTLKCSLAQHDYKALLNAINMNSVISNGPGRSNWPISQLQSGSVGWWGGGGGNLWLLQQIGVIGEKGLGVALLTSSHVGACLLWQVSSILCQKFLCSGFEYSVTSIAVVSGERGW